MDTNNTVLVLTDVKKKVSEERTEVPLEPRILKKNPSKDECGSDSRNLSRSIMPYVTPVSNIISEHNIQNNTDRNYSMCLFVFILVVLLEVAVNYDCGAIPAILIVLKTDFKISDVGQGLLGALPYIGIVIASPFVGRYFQKFEPKKMLIATIGANLVSTALLACSYCTWMLFLSRSLIGLTQAGFAIYAPVWVDQFAPEGKLTMWMGLTQGGVVLGTMLGYLITGFFRAANKEWRWAIFIQCVLIFILIILFFFVPAKYINVRSCEQNSNVKQQHLLQSSFKFENLDARLPEEDFISVYQEALSSADSEKTGSVELNTNGSFNSFVSMKNNDYYRNSNRPQVIGASSDLPPTAKSAGSGVALFSSMSNSLSVAPTQEYQLSVMNGLPLAKVSESPQKQIPKLPEVTVSSIERCSSGETLTSPGAVSLNSILLNKNLLQDNIAGKQCSRKLIPQANFLSILNTDNLKKHGSSRAEAEINFIRRTTNPKIQLETLDNSMTIFPTSTSPNMGRCFSLFTANPSTTVLEALKISSAKPEIDEQCSIPEPLDVESANSGASISKPYSEEHRSIGMRQSVIGSLLNLNSKNNAFRIERGALARNGLNVTNMKQGTRHTLKRLLTNPIYVSVTLALCSLFFEVTGIQFWSTRFFEEIMKVEAYVILVTFSTTAATAPIFGVLFGGILIDRIGGYKSDSGMFKSLVTCSVLAGLCVFFGFIASVIDYFSAVIVCIWVILFLGGCILPAATGIIIAMVDADVRPFASGLSMTIYNVLGYILGTFVPGALIQVIGLYNGMRIIFLWSFLGFVGITVAACFAWKPHHLSRAVLIEEEKNRSPQPVLQTS